MAEQLRIFISYSRKDTAFVDRLEADLRSYEFQVWVDRRKIEGGDDFQSLIQEAIESTQVMLVIVSPDAIASDWVKREFRHAFRTKKTVIPLILRSVEKMPMELNDIHWVEFVDRAYEDAIRDLLNALAHIEPVPQLPRRERSSIVIEDAGPLDLVTPHPAPAPPDPELDDLYAAGVAAKARRDLVRTVLYWQQILDREPGYRNGFLKQEIESIYAELLPKRIAALRERANAACEKGEWGQEIGSWDALLALAPEDFEAGDRRKLAIHNQQWAFMYNQAATFVDKGDFDSAREQLNDLYRYAPEYGDPLTLANQIGLMRRKSIVSNLNSLDEQAKSITGNIQYLKTLQAKVDGSKKAAVWHFLIEGRDGKNFHIDLLLMLVCSPFVSWVLLLIINYNGAIDNFVISMEPERYATMASWQITGNLWISGICLPGVLIPLVLVGAVLIFLHITYNRRSKSLKANIEVLEKTLQNNRKERETLMLNGRGSG
jgi:tetratricopeptide (TPR) repeat protein